MPVDTSFYDTRQQPQPSVLDTFAKAQGVRNMIDQGQMRQQQLQAGAEALKEHTAENADKETQRQEEETLKGIMAKTGGASVPTLQAAAGAVRAKTFLALQDSYTKEAKARSEISKDELAKSQYANQQLAGLTEHAMALSPEEYAAQYPNLIASAKAIDPTLNLPTGQMIPQADMGSLRLRFTTHDNLDKEELAKRQAAAEKRAAALADPQLQSAKNAALNSTPNAGGLTPDQQRQADQAQATLDAPTKPAVAMTPAAEQQHIRIGQAIRPPAEASGIPELAGVDKNLRAPAAAAYSKSGQAYADAMSAANEIQGVIDLVRSGNKAAGSNLPLLGVGALNAINGIKRMNGAEISQYAGAGSLWDNIVGKTGALTEGQPIPPDVLNDIEALHKRLAEGALKKHTDEVAAINQSHGSKFKPVELAKPTPRADPKVQAYADKYFGGDLAKAQAAIAQQQGK